MILALACLKPERNPLKRTLFLSFIYLATAPLFAQDETGRTALRVIIEERNASILKSLLAGDAAAYAAHFTENAFMMFPGAPLIRGRENILREREADFKKIKVIDGKIETLDLDYSGDLAYEIGAFRYSFKSNEGQVRDVKGKYLVIWKRSSDGIWLVQGDVGLQD